MTYSGNRPTLMNQDNVPGALRGRLQKRKFSCEWGKWLADRNVSTASGACTSATRVPAVNPALQGVTIGFNSSTSPVGQRGRAHSRWVAPFLDGQFRNVDHDARPCERSPSCQWPASRKSFKCLIGMDSSCKETHAITSLT